METRKPLWSILVCGVPSRLYVGPYRYDGSSHLLDLLCDLDKQISDRPIELLYLLDNKKRSVGAKRNALLDLAQGQYISFVDDDDSVSANYVEAVMNAIPWEVYGDEPILEPDVVCFRQICTHVATGYVERCSYSLKYKYEQGRDFDIGTGDPMNSGWWRGLPSHTMILRAELAKRCRFPDSSFGEDMDFCAQFAKLARTEVQIPEVLYYYNWNPRTSETRG